VPIRIEAADDPRISDYIGLRDRRESDEFLIAETKQVIERLMKSRLKIRSMLFSTKAHAKLWPMVQHVDAPIYVAEMEILEGIAGFPVHRGVLASANRPAWPDLLDVLATARRIVVLEGSNDHENIGAVARSARALGFDALVLDPTCADPYYRRAVRVSMGEILHLPVVRCEPWPSALDSIAHAGFETWALTTSPTANSLFDMVMPEKVALVAGAEGPGLTAEAQARTHYDVRIPMHHGVDSLNLGHALAIAMAAVSPPGD
jgi:tRNA G18 (ribose-2'-O)-methylase SpoU